MYALSIFIESYKQVWDELWLFICILAASLPNLLVIFYLDEDPEYLDSDIEAGEMPHYYFHRNLLFSTFVSILKHFFGEYY